MEDNNIGYNVDIETIQKSKLFSKFVKLEEAKTKEPTKPRILSKNSKKLEQEQIYFDENTNQKQQKQPKQSDIINESSIYQDFAQYTKQQSPERIIKPTTQVPVEKQASLQTTINQTETIQVKDSFNQNFHQIDKLNVQPKHIINEFDGKNLIGDDKQPQIYQLSNQQLQNQVNKMNQMVNDIRKKALEEHTSYQNHIFNLNDQVAQLQEKIYQLQKSEDFLQLENERLKNRLTQENLLRTKIDEDFKDISLKGLELNDRLSQTETQVQRQREELIHLRSQSEQYKGDVFIYKQQVQSLTEKNQYLEQQLRIEIQKKEMIQNQLIDAQDKLHRSQIDLEGQRSEILEYRRMISEAQMEVDLLRKQVSDQRQQNLELGRINANTQQQLLQSNSQVEQLKSQIIHFENQYQLNQRQALQKEYQHIPNNYIQQQQTLPLAIPQQFNLSNTIQKDDQQFSDEKNKEKYQMYQKQQMIKNAQALQGGQNYFKEKDSLQEQLDREIKDIESQLLNSQLKRQQITIELKKIEDSRTRTGANIRRKQELENQLQNSDQIIVNLKNKLRETNSLLN